MLDRHISQVLLSASEQNPVVTLMGPRQSGKTTLCRALFPNHLYISLESPDNLSIAMEDPRGLLSSGHQLILDEVQRAPQLLSYIQGIVDETQKNGQFILTASQNPLLMKSVSQTLAGRTAILRLLPFSLSELFTRPPFDPAILPSESEPLNENCWETLFRGFYPRIHDKNLPVSEWYADYFRTFVERDLSEIVVVSDVRAFENCVRLAAASTATELNLSRISTDVGVQQQTIRRWLNALEIGFLATTIPVHFANFRKRLRKRPRLHFLDSGFLCYLLGIRDAETLAIHPLRGAIFESYVAAEILKSFANRRQEAPLYTWRATTGHEIDLLLDYGLELLPIEVKSGQTITAESVKNLDRWTQLDGNHNRGGLVVSGGNQRFRLKEYEVLPWHLT